MINKDYLKKLNMFLGFNLSYKLNENEIIFFLDVETKYIIKKLDDYFVIYMKERNIETELAQFQYKIDMLRYFALMLKGLSGPTIEYPNLNKLDSIDNIEELVLFMDKHDECVLYSIDKVVEDKIILKVSLNDEYEILFADKYKTEYSIEKNGKAPLIYKRFYTEVVYYNAMIKRFDEYEYMFQDRLDYECRFKLLGYGN